MKKKIDLEEYHIQKRQKADYNKISLSLKYFQFFSIQLRAVNFNFPFQEVESSNKFYNLIDIKT
jgi:hypothetical protein